ncbi:hypothetical protein XO10_02095 [Marinitoga sp. 1135]|uniref:CRISPR-associated endoribonuclease Cas6 n=1 Tax=unclassified Marinitoga TaxID=2640159 RepID=UPI00095056AC|nr:MULTISPECIES: CRISPR-associated endoribonuclease Cas6 [unclassified Marinitoga]APT75359.1 hypothetical protein LN42_02380 [Marinitoga sp. 1137]NUU95089.1 hypothetical protein [Marinitoga sp. 1135]
MIEGDTIFYSIVIELKALESGVIPTFPGKKIHGLFFNILKDVDKEISYKLHEDKNYKPFTVSSFLGKKIDEPVTILKGKRYYIRMTFLEEKIFILFTTKIFKNKIFKEKINIEDISFSIIRIIFDKEHSKWANLLTIDDLLKENYDNKISLTFITPTLFKTGDKHLRYPDPEKIFNSLLIKFNKYSPYKLNEKVKEKFNTIKIIQRKTHLKYIYFPNFYLQGFTGNVVFEIPEDNYELKKTANILSDFAFYAGVGYKTTMGLGQTRREEPVNV